VLDEADVMIDTQGHQDQTIRIYKYVYKCVYVCEIIHAHANYT